VGRPDLHGFALLTLAALATRSGQSSEAIALYHEAEGRFAQTDLWEAQAGCLNNLAIAYHGASRHEDAIDALEASRVLAMEHEDTPSLIRNLGNLAMIHRELGDHAAALQYGETCFKLLQEAPNPLNEAYLLNGHGVSLFRLERTDEAIYFYQRSLEIKESLGRTADTVSTLSNLVQAHLRAGNLAATDECLERTEALLEKMTHRQAEAIVRMTRGERARQVGDEAGFLEAFLQTQEFCQKHDLNRLHGELLNSILALIVEGVISAETEEALAVRCPETSHQGDSGAEKIANQAIALTEAARFTDERIRALQHGARIAARDGNGMLAWEREKLAAALASSLESANADRRLRALGLQHQLEQAQSTATAERQRRQALDQLNRRLQKLLDEREEMVGIVAHDLRNPLGGMRTFFGLLRTMLARGESPERIGDVLRELESSAASLLRITEGLIEWGRLDDATGAVTEGISWAEVAQESIDSYQGNAQGKKIVMEFTAEAGLPLLHVPRSSLRRIVDNLLGNALKFSPKHSAVYLRLKKTEAAICLEIQDHGPGITEAEQSLLFQRLQKLSARPTANEPSTGIGLAATKRTVDRLGGILDCQSVPGTGSTFRVLLPLTLEP
jgi:signal transduction histidine kinase